MPQPPYLSTEFLAAVITFFERERGAPVHNRVSQRCGYNASSGCLTFCERERGRQRSTGKFAAHTDGGEVGRGVGWGQKVLANPIVRGEDIVDGFRVCICPGQAIPHMDNRRMGTQS